MFTDDLEWKLGDALSMRMDRFYISQNAIIAAVEIGADRKTDPLVSKRTSAMKRGRLFIWLP
jgi:hypothetical protein